MISLSQMKIVEEKLQNKMPLPENVKAEVESDVALAGGVWRDPQLGTRKAAVLIPLITRQSGMHILLTKRTDHLPSHAGQVAFPGGKVEEKDESIVHTALRETEEEVGLQRDYVNVLGVLNSYETGTGFDVSPVVGLVSEGFKLEIDQQEVSDTFEVPLSFILNKANHEIKTLHYKGADRRYYSIVYGEHNIWGATAAILVNFCTVLRQYAE